MKVSVPVQQQECFGAPQKQNVDGRGVGPFMYFFFSHYPPLTNYVQTITPQVLFFPLVKGVY